MHTNHLSLKETAYHFNLGDHNVVGKSERIYYEEGSQALYKEQRGRSKNMSSKPINENKGRYGYRRITIRDEKSWIYNKP